MSITTISLALGNPTYRNPFAKTFKSCGLLSNKIIELTVLAVVSITETEASRLFNTYNFPFVLDTQYWIQYPALICSG